MKNLPDKIYLNLGDLTEEEYNESDFNDLSEVTWSEDDVQGRNLEYVRKDSLIERACEWLRTHREYDYLELISSYNYCGACNLNNKKMIEDFKRYLEENKAMSIEEMQKQIELTMPTPKQIVKSIDKKLKEKELIVNNILSKHAKSN